MKRNHLGEFEELILLAVATLADDAYGVTVRRFIKEQAKRTVNISAVHEGLKRLERKGHLNSHFGGATSERGGRRKRFFELTNSGKSTLDHVMSLRLQLYSKVPHFNPTPIK